MVIKQSEASSLALLGTFFSTTQQSTGLLLPNFLRAKKRCLRGNGHPTNGSQNLFRLGAPTNFDRSAVLIAPFISHWERSQTNHFKSRLCRTSKKLRYQMVSKLFWCERRDLNPYESPHTPLKRARLPIPPLSRQRNEL